MFDKKLSVCLAAVTLCGTSAAYAGNDQLAKALEAISAPSNATGVGPAAGKNKVPVKPAWEVMAADIGKKDAPCMMRYRDGTNVMGYIGPSKGWNESYFFVSGPNVPFTNYPDKLRVALVSDGDENQTVKAFHYPAGKNQYALLFKLTDFAAALDVMDDSEDVAVLLMEETDFKYKQSLFSGGWTGGHAAREKLRACLEKKK